MVAALAEEGEAEEEDDALVAVRTGPVDKNGLNSTPAAIWTSFPVSFFASAPFPHGENLGVSRIWHSSWVLDCSRCLNLGYADSLGIVEDTFHPCNKIRMLRAMRT